MNTTVTTESIKELILSVNYHHEDEKCTACFITLKNGFKVTGVSGVVDKSKFDKAIGEKYAYENAFNELWKLEGYRLQWVLHTQKEIEEWARDNPFEWVNGRYLSKNLQRLG